MKVIKIQFKGSETGKEHSCYSVDSVASGLAENFPYPDINVSLIS